MPDIRFYHLQSQTAIQALPTLLSRALDKGYKILLRTRDQEEAMAIDSYLWTYQAESFLPHGLVGGDHDASQPVLITANSDSDVTGRQVLISTYGLSDPEIPESFTMYCRLLNGNDPADIQQGRSEWKILKEKGMPLTYWQQSETGSWEQKA